MKRRVNKALSLIIAVVLVIGIMPITTAFAADGDTFVYDVGSYGKNAGTQTFETTNDTWSYETRSSGSFAFNNNSVSGLQVNVSSKGWWAIRVKIPDSGTYDMKINKSSNPYGGETTVYFGKAELGVEAIMQTSPIGTVDFTNYESTDNVTSPLEEAEIGKVEAGSAGEYIIVFYVSKAGNKGGRQYFDKVILSKSDEVITTTGTKVIYNMNTNHAESGAWVDTVQFKNTNGFWAYEGANKPFSDSAYVRENPNGLGVEAFIAKNAWWAVRVYIPQSGEYTLKLNQTRYSNGGTANIHFGKANEGTEAILEKTPVGSACFYADTQTSVPDAEVGSISVDAPGEYILIFQSVAPGDGANGTRYRQIFKEIILDGGNGTVPMLDISADADTIIIGETAIVTATAVLMSDGVTSANATISYAVDAADASIASVDANGVVTGLSEGEATIIATATQNSSSSSKSIEITVTAPEEENEGEILEDTNVSIAVMPENVAGGSVSGVENVVGEVEIGSKITVTATPNDGYKFAYWKNSSGKVLSVNETETFIVNTNTAITAVFDEISDASTENFGVYLYNANGMPFFANENVSANTLFYDAIAEAKEPELAGYVFSHWSKTEDAAKIAEDAVVNAVTRATAVYGDSTERYAVKVNGNVVASEKKYGESITVTSADKDFSCWKLGDKVISYERSYSFFVWENIELTEVKNGEIEAAPVAVISKSGENCHLVYSVPVGYTKIEAGIIFGNRSGITVSSTDGYKVAETFGTGQLTVSSDYEYARGYIIFKTPANEIRVIYAD